MHRAPDAHRFRASPAPGRSRAAAGARAARPRSDGRRATRSRPSRPPGPPGAGRRSTRRAGSASASRPSCSAASRRRPISKPPTRSSRSPKAAIRTRSKKCATARRCWRSAAPSSRSPASSWTTRRCARRSTAWSASAMAFAGEYPRRRHADRHRRAPASAAAAAGGARARRRRRPRRPGGARHGRGRPRRSIEGRVARISPAIAEGNRTLPIEAEVPERGGTLRPGTFAQRRDRHRRDARRWSCRSRRSWSSPASRRCCVVKDGKVARAARPHRPPRRRSRRDPRRRSAAATWSIIAARAAWPTAPPVTRRASRPSCAPSPPSASSARSSPRCSILALVVVGAAAFFRLGVDRFPAVDLPTSWSAPSLPGALASRRSRPGLRRRSKRRSTRVEGISELRSVSAPGQSIVIATFNLDRDIDAAAQDVRDRVAAGRCASCRDDVEPPMITKQDNDASPVADDRAVRQPVDPRADRDRRQDRQGAARARRRASAKCTIVGGLERAINIWVDADRLAAYQLPITDVRDALAAAERRPARRQRHHRPSASRRCARWAASPTPTQFNDLVDRHAQRRADPRARHRPRRGRHQGAALVRAPQRRADGGPRGPPPVGRQHGRGDRGRQGEPRARPAAAAGRRVDSTVIRDQSRYIYAALHEINVHLVLGSILACLVVFAFMRNWRATVIAGVAIPTSVDRRPSA